MKIEGYLQDDEVSPAFWCSEDVETRIDSRIDRQVYKLVGEYNYSYSKLCEIPPEIRNKLINGVPVSWSNVIKCWGYTKTGALKHIAASSLSAACRKDSLLCRKLHAMPERLDPTCFPGTCVGQVVLRKQVSTRNAKEKHRHSIAPMQDCGPSKAEAISRPTAGAQRRKLSAETASLRGRAGKEKGSNLVMTPTKASKVHKCVLKGCHSLTARQNSKTKRRRNMPKAASVVQVTIGKGRLKRKLQARKVAQAIAAVEAVPDDISGNLLEGRRSAIPEDILVAPSNTEAMFLAAGMRTPVLKPLDAFSECGSTFSHSAKTSPQLGQSLENAERLMHAFEMQGKAAAQHLHSSTTPIVAARQRKRKNAF